MPASSWPAGNDATLTTAVCTDRARWLGRGGDTAHPRGDAGPDGAGRRIAHPRAAAAQPVDTGLDPAAVLRVRLQLAPGAHTTLTFGTSIAHAPEVLTERVDRYRQRAHVQRASNMSHTMAGVRLHEMQMDTSTWQAMLKLQSLLCAQHTRDHAGGDAQAASAQDARCHRRSLWRHGISGERPLLRVDISDEAGVALVQTLKRMLRLWTSAGLGVDLVVINAEPASYLSPVQRSTGLAAGAPPRAAGRALASAPARDAARAGRIGLVGRRAGHAHPAGACEPAGRWPHARAVAGSGRSLSWSAWAEDAAWPPGGCRCASRWMASRASPVLSQCEATFAPPTAPLRLRGKASRAPARPWVNVLANPGFGCQVSERGAGMTWAGNSRMHQLTPWSNDPVSDPAGEGLMLEDRDRAQAYALGRHAHQGPVAVVHQPGLTELSAAGGRPVGEPALVRGP